jgi:hypothetical protein
MKARACRAIIEKNMPSVLEDVCIKLLTAAENDPALARPDGTARSDRGWFV